VSKIEKLTPEQEEYLPVFRDEWFKIGWSNDPANKKEAEESIAGMYECIDLAHPKFMWVESPIQAQILLNIIDNVPEMINGLDEFITASTSPAELFAFFEEKFSIPESISNTALVGFNNDFSIKVIVGSEMEKLLLNIDDSKFLSELRRRVTKTLDDPVFISITDKMTNNIVETLVPWVVVNIENALTDCYDLKPAITAAAISGIFHSLKTLSFDYQSTLLYGQTDAYWVAFYKFCQHIGVVYEDDASKKLDLWEKFVKSAGWAYPFTQICIICDRPEVALRDDNNVLDGENGPAIKFRDGWEVYSSHGVMVDKWIIMEPEKITIQDIDAQDNIEVKRIMQNQMGIGKYLEASGAKTIHMDIRDDAGFVIYSSEGEGDDDKKPVGFPRALMVDKEGRHFLCGTDTSTDRVYYMEVPNTCTTCAEAGSALAGFDENNIIAAS
jgi:hypothetical protein